METASLWQVMNWFGHCEVSLVLIWPKHTLNAGAVRLAPTAAMVVFSPSLSLAETFCLPHFPNQTEKQRQREVHEAMLAGHPSVDSCAQRLSVA